MSWTILFRQGHTNRPECSRCEELTSSSADICVSRIRLDAGLEVIDQSGFAGNAMPSTSVTATPLLFGGSHRCDEQRESKCKIRLSTGVDRSQTAMPHKQEMYTECRSTISCKSSHAKQVQAEETAMSHKHEIAECIAQN